jgi:hypothetical protein
LPLLKRKSEEDVFLTLHSILNYGNFFDVLVLGLSIHTVDVTPGGDLT